MAHKVLILPGAACPPAMYASWLDALAGLGLDASVVTYPMHGDGEDPTGVTTNACEEHIEHLVRERCKKERPFILIGHSFGGLLALRVAQGNPKVRGLILVSPAPPQGVSIGFIAQLRLLRHARLYGPPMLTGRSFAFHEEDIRNHFLSGRPPIDAHGKSYTFSKESGAVLRRLVFDKPAIEPESILCPVHIFSGQDDRLFSTNVHLALCDLLNRSHATHQPKARVIQLPNTTHMPMFSASATLVASTLATQAQQLLSPARLEVAAE